MVIITLDILTQALASAFEIGREQAYRYAFSIIDFFGFDDRIVDNILTPEERQLFFRLQEKGLVSPEREETVLHTGCPWRIHYWLLQKQRVLQYAGKLEMPVRAAPTPKAIPWKSGYEDIYSKVPGELWATRKTVTN